MTVLVSRGSHPVPPSAGLWRAWHLTDGRHILASHDEPVAELIRRAHDLNIRIADALDKQQRQVTA